MTLTTSATSKAQPRRRTRRLAIPGQHGAWAYLVVPLILGFLLVGWSGPVALYSVAWILAYPASFYLGRAVVIRWRRGNWSRLAKRELGYAIPWTVMAAVPSVILLILRPWLIWVGATLVVLWAVSIWLTRTGHERGFSNDLLLVAQAAVAMPLFWAIYTDTPDLGIGDPAAAEAWLVALICVVFFTGNVLHVKSLIREADDPRWKVASRIFNVGSMAMGLISPWLLLPFGFCAARSFAVGPNRSPLVIGNVEIVVSVLVVVGTYLALG